MDSGHHHSGRVADKWKRNSPIHRKRVPLLLAFIVIALFISSKTLISPSLLTLSRNSRPLRCAGVSGDKFLWYAPHSGFSNQLSEFKNAVLMAAILNRTLIVPPVLDHHAVALGSCPKFRVLDPNELRFKVWNHSIQLIRESSVQNLEIIDPLHSSLWGSNSKKGSLFRMLKTTRTVGGTRLLRANLLQPLKDIETINARLDCLDELMSNEQLFFGLSQALRKFPKETDKVLCHFCFKQKKVTNGVLPNDNSRKSQILISSIILLKTALDSLPLLSKVLKDATCYLLKNIYESICENEKYATMRKRIGEVIDEDVLHARVPFVARTQQCFAVKAGIDGFLDIARRSFCDTSEAIYNLASKYREDFKLPNLKIPYNSRQGFYFSIPNKDIQGKLPSKFIQVVKHGSNTHCSSLELASLNVRNKSAAKECYIRTEFCLEGL